MSPIPLRTIRTALIVVLLTAGLAAATGPAARAQSGGTGPSYLPDISELMGLESSELRDIVTRYASDRSGLFRFNSVPNSPRRREAAASFYRQWQGALDRIDFDALGIDGRIDWLLFRNMLDYQMALLGREEKMLAEVAPLVPFMDTIIRLQETRRRMEDIDSEQAARIVTELGKSINEIRKGVEAGQKPAPEAPAEKPGAARPAGRGAAAAAAVPKPQENKETEVTPIPATKTVAYRASRAIADLRRTFEQWFNYYNGYDPMFSWWVAKPYEVTAEKLKAYEDYLREKIVGFKKGEEDPIVGDPIGREALDVDLKAEMISYSPEQMMAIAEREFAWCEREMLRASRDMGFGDDWKAALEHVKGLHVEPGRQPDLIRDQAREAIAFLEERDLITIPQLAKDIWRIEMMSPERQKVNPFFLGGEVIQVSYPTNTMTYDEKMMSMRGNNIHFARATVQHELIPGHHLQGFYTERYNTHRRTFGTPFWTEGWALYWEMYLWDLDFPQTPENRVGMLFWRMHRCARIIFSLGFHLGTMTPQECIDFLVDRVGFELNNATAEVRRSFEGSYSPLYQAAYMIGGLQFRALHEEMVGSGRMTDRQFHDAILKMNNMPIEMVRARLLGQAPARDFTAAWRFAGDITDRPRNR
jgi:hypothetical protein